MPEELVNMIKRIVMDWISEINAEAENLYSSYFSDFIEFSKIRLDSGA